MAVKPKRNSGRKKPSIKKRTAKKSQKISQFKKNILIVLGVFLMISLVAFGYFLGQNDTDGPRPAQMDKSGKAYTTKQLLNDLSHLKTKEPKEKKVPAAVKVLKTEKRAAEERTLHKEKRKVGKTAEEAIQKKDIALEYRGKKPKLVIIIDDIHTAAQLRAVKALGMKITPSIFPPYELAPESNLLAKDLKHYMIHLPMESGTRQFNRQYRTLKISFNQEQIKARVGEIRKLFPSARYINNHTGSVFTADYKAMHTLYKALRKKGFVFVDSRTTGMSKVRKIAHEFGDVYVARDIFIDNTHTVPYIHKQLRQAVKTAKKKGYAVAIGHPHPVTIKALSRAKSIFKEVELVYIDDIYRKEHR